MSVAEITAQVEMLLHLNDSQMRAILADLYAHLRTVRAAFDGRDVSLEPDLRPFLPTSALPPTALESATG